MEDSIISDYNSDYNSEYNSDYNSEYNNDELDQNQLTYIYILLDWYSNCANYLSKDQLIVELRFIFKEITNILYLSNRDVKMVYRYYRYLYGTINETQQFYTSDQIVFCTKILELMINILINKFRLNINSNLQ